MKKDKQEFLYCADADEYRIYCKICYKLCMERYYENHPKSRTHIINIHKRQRLNNTNMKN